MKPKIYNQTIEKITRKKLFAWVAALWLVCPVSNIATAQNIVHIDFIGEKKAKVIDLQPQNAGTVIAEMKNMKSGEIMISNPTNKKLKVGDEVIYRKNRNGTYEILRSIGRSGEHDNGRGNQNSNGT